VYGPLLGAVHEFVRVAVQDVQSLVSSHRERASVSKCAAARRNAAGDVWISVTDESGRRRRDKSAFRLDAMELTPKRHKRNNQVAQIE
jgi:hypothetical protein